MSVEGTISIDVQFRDTTSSTGVQSLKTVTLRDATEYSTGKVAIVTGTVGTADVTVAIAPTSYKNSSGETVSFSCVDRVAVSTSRDFIVSEIGAAAVVFCKPNGSALFCTEGCGGDGIQLSPNYTAGTASYTMVLYGT